MRLLILGLMIAITSSLSPMTDEELYRRIFDIPPTAAPPTTAVPPATTRPIQLEYITINPLKNQYPRVDKDGQSCKCVPFYLCNSKREGVHSNNDTITGYGKLDIRFEDDGSLTCQEIVELCCTNPKGPEAKKPKPDPKNVKRCGYRNPDGIGAKFNGVNSQFGEFPWVTAILDSNGTYIGVGVLIHPEVVMTGAYVVRKYTAGRLKIRAGEWDTQTTNEIYDHEERNVRELYLHSGFAAKTLHNNIALLRLDRPLELAEHINVICLPEQDESFDSHKNCVANGWGKDVFGLEGRYAVILKTVEVDMVPNSRCNWLLKRTKLGTFYTLPDSLVCAGGEEGKDTCQGDGGAPLACPLGNNRYKLTGLVAGGVGCGQKDVPGVYTKVSKFRRWIDRKMAAWRLEPPSY